MASLASNSSNFDALSYLAANPDLIRAFGLDLAAASQHYNNIGHTEGRSLSFDALSYIASNNDLIDAYGADLTAATAHYINFGNSEGRSFSFDALNYISANRDLIDAFGTDQQSAKLHYVSMGYREQRNTYFNSGGYLAANADLQAAFGTDLDAARAHYIQHGFRENRQFAVDDYAENTSTLGRLSGNGRATGMIERPYDIDWFGSSMTQGTTYTLSVRFATAGLHDFALVDASGNTLASDRDQDGDGVHTVVYRPTVSGSYYAAIGGFDTGLYTLTAKNDGVTTTPVTTTFGDLPDDPSTSGRLAVGGSTTGLYDREEDKDWYAITLNAGTIYRFDLSGPGYWGLNVYSDGNNSLPSSNIIISSSSRAILVSPTSTGTYYVEVSGHFSTSTPYTLAASIGDDFGQTADSAGTWTIGSPLSVVSNYAFDKDWLAVTLTKGETYRFESSGNTSSPVLRLLDASGFRVHMETVGLFSSQTPQEVTIATTGTYYLEFESFNEGICNLTSQQISGNANFVDDFGNSFGTAGHLNMNGTTNGALEYRKDSDYLSVVLEKGKSYSFEIDAPSLGSVEFDIFSPGNDAAYLNPIRTENGRIFYEYTACATGNFAVYIDSNDYKLGSYSIKTTDNGMADDYANDTTTTGRLAVGGSLNGRIDYSGIDEFQGDSDWIAVSLEAGNSYALSLDSQNSNTRMSLLDAQGNGVGTSPFIDGNGDFSLRYTPISTGTYYASVTRLGSDHSPVSIYTVSASLFMG